MLSYVFTVSLDGKKLGIEHGIEPWRTLVRFEGSETRGVRTIQNVHLELLCRTLEILQPPDYLVNRGFAGTGPDLEVDAPFSDYRSTGTYTFRPTDVIASGHRAWLVEHQWPDGERGIQQTGAYVGAFWLIEERAIQWAQQQQKHPLVKLLTSDKHVQHLIVAPAETNIDTWEGATIKPQGYCLLTARDGFRKSSGVHAQFHVQFGRWSGTILVPRPLLWQLQTELDDQYPLIPPYWTLVARNGVETLLFSTDQKLQNCYSRGLPALPKHQVRDASGDYATFWSSPEAWNQFAKQHQLRATWRSVSRMPGAPHLEGEILILLTPEDAEKAYKVGAAKLPDIIHGLKPEDFVRINGTAAEAPAFEVTAMGHPCRGARAHATQDENGLVVFLPEGFRGWIYPDAGIQIPHGATIRKLDDQTSHPTELCVFANSKATWPSN
ncbi:MAG TPA: hypothetical protein VNG90_04240 [Candidatus Acidoferrum sp.]|nr:hypothetical protein [Candidatus Acidoferrum sp.]